MGKEVLKLVSIPFPVGQGGPASAEWDRPEGWAQIPAHRHSAFQSRERQQLVGLGFSENPGGGCRIWKIQPAPATCSLLGFELGAGPREVVTVKCVSVKGLL